MGSKIVQGCISCRTNNNVTHNFGQELQYNRIKDIRFERYSPSTLGKQNMQLSAIKPQFQQYIIKLRQDKQQFFDQYFQLTQIQVGQPIAQFKIKRISKILSINFIYDSYTVQNISNNLPNANLRKALNIINDYPLLISRIIPNKYIIPQGMYILYFCLNGQSKNKLQIVIDDRIPINQNNNYIYDQKKNSIWMLLVEKAFAKILGSYNNLLKLQPQEFFQDITGIPILNLSNFNHWYQDSYYLQSLSNQILGSTPIYYKFTLQNSTKLHISLWQPRKSYFYDENLQYSNFFIELAYKKDNKSYERKIFSQKIKNNKILLSEQIIQLESGQYFLHIYPLYPKEILRRINIVVYSSHRITLKFRQQNTFKKLKQEMIQHTFKNYIKNRKLSVLKEQKSISVIFLWDHYRGILCIKNLYPTVKQFRIEILDQKQQYISFENHYGTFCLISIESQKSCIISFIRKNNDDLGYFYKIIPL